MVIHSGYVAAAATRISPANGMLCYIKCMSYFPQLRPEFSGRFALATRTGRQTTVEEK